MGGCSEEGEESLVTRQPQCHLPRHAKTSLVSLEAAFENSSSAGFTWGRNKGAKTPTVLQEKKE